MTRTWLSLEGLFHALRVGQNHVRSLMQLRRAVPDQQLPPHSRTRGHDDQHQHEKRARHDRINRVIKNLGVPHCQFSGRPTGGDFHRIVLGIVTMCLFVVAINRLLWRPLYYYAERRYRLT